MVDEIGLTDKQAAFVFHYLDCLNASEAARRAGYNENTARVIGAENLTKPAIKAAIEKGMQERLMPRDEVLDRLARIARSDMRDLFTFDDEGKINGLNLSKDAPLDMISEFTPTRYGTKIKTYDKQSALETLGRFHKLWTDKVEHSGSIDVTQLSDDELRNIIKD